MSSSGASRLTLTTKGDLQGFSTLAARVPVGSDFRGVIASSAAALGLTYLGVPSVIGDTLLGAPAANFDFTAITGLYAHLVLLTNGRQSGGALATMDVLLNNDSAANYNVGRIQDIAAVVTATQTLGASAGRSGLLSGTNAAAGLTSMSIVFILNYAAATLKKQAFYLCAASDAAANDTNVELGSWWWTPAAAAVTRVTAQPNGGVNWVTGSRGTLLGIAV